MANKARITSPCCLPCNILSSIQLKFLKRLPWDVAPKLGYGFLVRTEKEPLDSCLLFGSDSTVGCQRIPPLPPTRLSSAIIINCRHLHLQGESDGEITKASKAAGSKVSKWRMRLVWELVHRRKLILHHLIICWLLQKIQNTTHYSVHVGAVRAQESYWKNMFLKV